MFVAHLAAAGPCVVQPGVVDLHAGASADTLVLVPRHRVPGGHTDLLHRAPREHRAADRAHAQVLLLGGQPACQERHHTQGLR